MWSLRAPLSFALVGLLLAACNAASAPPVDDEDAAIIDASTDTGTADTSVDPGPGPDFDFADTSPGGDVEGPFCDPFVDDDCGCAEGVVVSCYGGPIGTAGHGQCDSGYRVCRDGAFGDCLGDVLPGEEVCNGLDDDCDGSVDDGVTNVCGGCGDVPEEACGDLLDNDCDGAVDEVDAGCDCDDRTNQPCYGGPPGTGGVGTCRGGITSCVDGAWIDCAGQVVPGEEVCNGLDDDCDGLVDEGTLNACGECGSTPSEVCNGLDDDCDGIFDDGTRLTCGVCAGEPPPDEFCANGLDDDCDGDVDEECPCTGESFCYPGDPDHVGVGQCVAGSRSCDASGEFWTECIGYVLPTPEICDGFDNDCDGEIDIAPDGCSVCGSGVEVCDGLDNDCDGEIDEGTLNACGDCLGEVVPEETGGPDLCNGLDDDCDGLVDEGLVNACGLCDDSCYSAVEDPDPDDFLDEGAELIPADDEANPTGRAGVTLSSQTFIPPFLWAANHEHDSVSRFNTDVNEEQGRYWVGSNPSRTGVDLDGNVWIGGRNDGRLTKILWDVERCPDRNGNGTIETSRPGALGPLNSPGDPFADECVVYSAVPNPSRTSIRGSAAGPDGRVWIGYSGGGVQSIDPHTFELGTFHDSGGAPVYRAGEDGVYRPSLLGDGSPETADTGGVYGLVVDSGGLLYLSSYTRTTLAAFDTFEERWAAIYVDYPCGLYGIAVDGQSRVWTGGYPNCRGVGAFDPATMTAHSFAVVDGFSPTPGATMTVDMSRPSGCGSPGMCVTGVGVEPATGDVWASFYAAGYTGRLVLDELDLSRSEWHFIGTGRNPDGSFLPGVSADLRGVGFDRNGFAWTLGLGSGNVWKIDPDTEQRAADLPDGAPIGVGTHYTYSDFTGSTALTFTAPRALWSFVFRSGYPDAEVDAISWEAHVPVGTSAGIRIRPLDALENPVGDWFPASSAPEPYIEYPALEASHHIDLGDVEMVGDTFEVEILFATSEIDRRPIVHRVELFWQRP